MGTVGHFLLILAFARTQASTLTPYLYGQIGFAMFCGWLVFGHIPDASSALILKMPEKNLTLISERITPQTFGDARFPTGRCSTTPAGTLRMLAYFSIWPLSLRRVLSLSCFS